MHFRTLLVPTLLATTATLFTRDTSRAFTHTTVPSGVLTLFIIIIIITIFAAQCKDNGFSFLLLVHEPS